MNRRRIKFVWGASKVIRGHWRLGLFGFYNREEGKHEDGLAISVRGVLLWSGAGLLLAYIAAATALFWIWQKNSYSLLTYKDALLRPIRTKEVRDLQGQAFIAQGMDSMRAKRYSEAVALLRQGLANHPNDLKARLMLAQFYIAANQRPMALKTLQDGLDNDYPGRIFLGGMFDVAEQGEDYDLVVRLSERYLPKLPGEAFLAERHWLALRQFGALIASNHFTEALALANAEAPGDGSSEHQVLALLGLKRWNEALRVLAEWDARKGADIRAVARLRARTLREAQRFDEMEVELARLHDLSPADPRPRVFGIVQRAMAGRDASAQAAFKDYLFRFGGTTQNLQLVAEPLAEIGQTALVEQCAVAAAERGYPAEPYQVLLVQCYVQRGDGAAAARTFAAMKPSPTTGRTAPLNQAWREWMRRLIEAASSTGDTAGPALVEFLHQRPWPIKIFRRSIEALRAASQLETARDVVAVASGAFPASTWVADQRSEIVQAIAAREAAAAKAAPAAVAVAGLPPERVFFQRLDDALARSQWDAAEQLLRDARTAKPLPGWVSSRDGDLRFAQLRIARGRGEMAELISTAKFLLNGDPERARRVTEVAREIASQGERDAGVTLAREVLRSVPDYPPAVRLLSELQPKKAPAKK